MANPNGNGVQRSIVGWDGTTPYPTQPYASDGTVGYIPR